MKVKQNIWFVWIMILSLTITMVSCDSDDDTHDDIIKVTKIEVEAINDDLIILEVADEYALSLTLLPENATDKDAYTYTYISSNEDVFRVSDDGIIKAIGVGEAALRIDADNNTDLWTSVTIRVNSKLFLITSLDVENSYQDYYTGIDKTIDLSEVITITPEYATEKNLIYASDNPSVATVTRRGIVSTVGLGDATISIKSDDGSEVETTMKIHVRNTFYENLSREGWSVTTSHPYFPDAAVIGSPESLIDAPEAYATTADEPTALCLVKPGKSLGGVTVANDEEVHFIIDMKQQQAFSAFRLRHRVKNSSANLRLLEASVYGSNNGVDFDLVADKLAIDVENTEVIVDLPKTVSYRYFKLTYDKTSPSGNTVQISDFNIIKLAFEAL